MIPGREMFFIKWMKEILNDSGKRNVLHKVDEGDFE
ncbi:hypothetical protein J2S19_003418 [Metabacillus malikii]|uniref:Uncharacterized protein n=1 Tax=Metabacillus malikii TaxID=1504265 RepID=A0ABT9ZK34_9BACI|nr:hypothetical protein [Metabacillus malikii]